MKAPPANLPTPALIPVEGFQPSSLPAFQPLPRAPSKGSSLPILDPHLAIKSVALLIPLLTLLAACSTSPQLAPTSTPPCYLPVPPNDVIVQRTPFPEDVTVIENEGKICFYQISESAFDVQLSSSGCHATYCTLIFERTGDIEIDQDTFTIQFHSSYVLKDVGSVRDSGEVCECAADCGGAGYLRFQTNELRTGIYSIQLGETKIGALVVPFDGNDRCWTTEITATPTPEPASYPPPPAQTPGPYP